MANPKLLANLEDRVPASSLSILVTQGQHPSGDGRISPSGQRVGVGTLDMRSDLFHGPRAGRSVSAENVDIIANEANGADSGVIPASARAWAVEKVASHIKSAHSDALT